MKRYVSVDFLRGFAIQAMLVLHIFIETFDTDLLLGAIEGEGSVGLQILAIFIVFFGSYAGFFITISGFGHSISILKRYENLIQSGEEKPCRKILGQQILRGFMILVLGVVGIRILDGYILLPILNAAAGINMTFEWVGELFWFNIIPFLGLSTMIVGAIYAGLLKHYGNDYTKIRKTLWLIVIFVWIITPAVLYAIRSIPGFGLKPYRNWETRDMKTNILFILLTPIAGRQQALFPWISAMFLGSIIATEMHATPMTKKIRNKWFVIALSMFIFGLIMHVGFFIIAGGMEGDAQANFEAALIGDTLGLEMRSTSFMLLIGGSEIFIFILFLWMVEGKGRAAKFAKHTKFFRRTGMISLSIYGYQHLHYFMVYYLETWMGLPFHDQEETWWQSLLIIIISMEIFNLIWLLWEKVNFVGGFEWLFALILSGFKKGIFNLLNPKDFLHNVEPLGQPTISDGSKDN